MAETYDFSDFEDEKDLDGFSPLADGQFHLVVHEVDDSRQEGDFVQLSFTVLGGTVEGQNGKQFRCRFLDPASSHKDGGKFCRRRQARMLLVTGVIDKSSLGGQVEIDWQNAVMKHIKAAVVTKQRTDDEGNKRNGFPEIEGLNFWSPLDEDAAHIPHNEEYLMMAAEAGQANLQSLLEGGSPPAKKSAAPATPPAAKTPPAKSAPPASKPKGSYANL